MIRGGFTFGRPVLRAVVVIPWADATGRPNEARAELTFLVDTGTDQTIICPRDYEVRLGLPLSAAPRISGRIAGVGGSSAMRAIAGSVELQEEDGGWRSISLVLAIPESAPNQPPLQVSLLGADVWGLGVLTVDRPRGRLTLDLG